MEFGLLILLFLVVMIVVPVLAISAYVRVQRIEAKLPQLERRLARLESPLASEPAPAAVSTPTPDSAVKPPVVVAAPGAAPPQAVTPAPAAPRAPVVRPMTPSRPPVDLESMIAGQWLNRIGLLLVFVAAYFALKWEFDNNVLGPSGRVALWTLIGVGLMAYGQWLLGRGYTYLSEGLTGLGGAVIYLSLYFGWSYYKLFPQGLAFAAMIVVTASLLALAIGRDSPRVALLGLIGGFLTPLLTSTGQDAQVVLFSYLLILDAGLLVLARARQWRGLEPLAFVCSTAFFWGWYETFYHVAEPLARTTLFATLFFAVFTTLPVIRSRATGRILPEQVVQALLNAGNYLLTLYAMLWPDRKWALTVAVLALAALHLVITEALPRFEDAKPVTRMLFAGLALTFVTLAIPIRLGGSWITIAWAIEGAVLLWSGFRAQWWFLRTAGLVLYGVAVVRLVLVMPPGGAFLLNERLGTFAVIIACFGIALYLRSLHPVELEEQERSALTMIGVGINLLAVWALSLEIYEYFEPRLAGDAERIHNALLGRQLALSLLWTAYACGLVLAGVRQAVAGLRWQGLALFGLAVAKVFFYDLSFLSGGSRILSSIVLGIVLIAVSFLYQRRLAEQKAGSER